MLFAVTENGRMRWTEDWSMPVPIPDKIGLEREQIVAIFNYKPAASEPIRRLLAGC